MKSELLLIKRSCTCTLYIFCVCCTVCCWLHRIYCKVVYYLQRSVSEVEWNGNSRKRKYRLGHKGKVGGGGGEVGGTGGNVYVI